MIWTIDGEAWSPVGVRLRIQARQAEKQQKGQSGLRRLVQSTLINKSHLEILLFVLFALFLSDSLQQCLVDSLFLFVLGLLLLCIFLLFLEIHFKPQDGCDPGVTVQLFATGVQAWENVHFTAPLFDIFDEPIEVFSSVEIFGSEQFIRYEKSVNCTQFVAFFDVTLTISNLVEGSLHRCLKLFKCSHFIQCFCILQMLSHLRVCQSLSKTGNPASRGFHKHKLF